MLITPFDKLLGGFPGWALSGCGAGKDIYTVHPFGFIPAFLPEARYTALYTINGVPPPALSVPLMPTGLHLVADDDATQAATAVTAEKNKQRETATNRFTIEVRGHARPKDYNQNRP